jgi:signal recognition particle subunit SRP14
MAPTMRKRDKKKEKAKADFVARKRKELYEDVAPQGRRTAGAAEEGGKKKLGHRQRVSPADDLFSLESNADAFGF